MKIFCVPTYATSLGQAYKKVGMHKTQKPNFRLHI